LTSQLPYAVQVFDEGTLIIVRRAYALLDAVPGMLIPQGVYRPPGASRYARGGWIDEHVNKLWIAFQDADRALDNVRNRSVMKSLAESAKALQHRATLVFRDFRK
jgi:hypothetical protein